MPDGKAIQMGTSHNLGQNFSKPFDIKFLGRDGQNHYAWTASWGVSWRLISAMIMLHGDDRGLVIPPRIAPIQAVIVPIYYKTGDQEVIQQKSQSVLNELTNAGIAANLDNREQYTPGWKFNEWEMKGVPLRIEIGPKDVEKKQSTLVRRDNKTKAAIKEDEVVSETKRCLEDIQSNLRVKAKAILDASISNTDDYDQFKKTLSERGGFIHSCWCGEVACEDKIKTETGATIRTIPFNEQASGKCILCGKPGTKMAYFAKSY